MNTHNRSNLRTFFAVGAALMATGVGHSRVEAAQKQEIPVLVTLADPEDTAGARIFSDGLGTYSQRTDAKLKSLIGLDGQLRFQTYDSPTRSVTVSFTGYTAVNGALPFSGAKKVQGNIVTLGEDTHGDGMLTAVQLDSGAKGERFNLLSSDFLPGQTRRIGLQLTFPIVNGRTTQNWRIRWGGGETVGGVTADLATVQRVSTSAWMIYADDNDKAAVGLSGSTTPTGVYSIPFGVLVEIGK